MNLIDAILLTILAFLLFCFLICSRENTNENINKVETKERK